MLLLAFVVPLTAYAKIAVGGTLFGQDLAAFLLLPFLLRERGALDRLRTIRFVFVLLAIWLLGQVLTDLVRQSAPEDFARGWLKIIFLGVQLAMLWLLLSRNLLMFTSYMAGTAVFAAASIRHADPSFQEQAWRFFYAPAILIGAAVAGALLLQWSGRGKVWIVVLMIAAAGVLNLLVASRSTFGIAEMTALYIGISVYVASRPRLSQAMTPSRFGLFVLAGAAAAQLLIAGYSLAAQSGVMGDDAQRKYEEQTSGNLSLLQSGRTETLVSLQAVADSPILGHGSWARDMYYVNMLHLKLMENGLEAAQTDDEDEADLIPTHSHLFGAWVEAGIAGAVFWCSILWICFVALYRLLKSPQLPSPLVAYVAFAMIWDVLFSPFGAEARFLRAGEIALMLYVFRSLPKPVAVKRVPAAQRGWARPGPGLARPR